MARSVGLAGVTEWRVWCREGKRPANVPANPAKVYQETGWQGWGHWLGTGNTKKGDVLFLPFAEALVVARSLGLASKKEWCAWCKSGARPANVPSMPDRVYVDHGWQGMRHWLGTSPGGTATRFLPFAEALAVARSLGLASYKEWRAWCKSGARPSNVPSNPQQAYVDRGWQGIRHWLGTTPGGGGGAPDRTPASSGAAPRAHKRERIPPPPTTDSARTPGGGGGKRARRG